jgi:hypothetical protein
LFFFSLVAAKLLLTHVKRTKKDKNDTSADIDEYKVVKAPPYEKNNKSYGLTTIYVRHTSIRGLLGKPVSI